MQYTEKKVNCKGNLTATKFFANESETQPDSCTHDYI